MIRIENKTYLVFLIKKHENLAALYLKKVVNVFKLFRKKIHIFKYKKNSA